MKYCIDEGPEISVMFAVSKERITRIELNDSQKNCFSWEIISDCPQSKLEEIICCWMKNYAKKIKKRDPLPLAYPEAVSPFTMSVLAKLAAIPFGKWKSYHAIACELESPNKSRAVGGACGRNPFPLVIPCHRVLAKGGSLGGFSCGLSIKEKLLKHEDISYYSP